MVDRRRGLVLQRETSVGRDDSVSPETRAALAARQSPSPAPPRSRRAPPSPWFRGRGHQRSPSPMRLDSPDPEDFSTSEDEIATVATVTSSEGEELRDPEGERPAHSLGLELSPIGEIDESILGSTSVLSSMEVLNGRLISSRLPDLSPILEPDGVLVASVSPDSGSPPLSPTAAVRLCQASMDASEPAMVSPHDSLLDEDGCGLCAGVDGVMAVIRSEVDEAVPRVAQASMDGVELEHGIVSGGSGAASGARRSTMASAEGLCHFGELLNSHHLTLSIDASAVGGGPVSGDLQNVNFAKSGAVSVHPKHSEFVGHCGGGAVSEEARFLPGTRGAMRPQPTDGLRQPLSSPVEPVSVVEGGLVPFELPLPPSLALPLARALDVEQGGFSSVKQCDDGGVQMLTQVTDLVETGSIPPLCSSLVEKESSMTSLLAPVAMAAEGLTGDGGRLAGPVLGVEQFCCGTLGMGIGGAVSEEVRAASVARETLRSQPTDGLRQFPSSPTVPECGVEGGGRSYAAAVRPDRRSDVRLQFVPSASHDDRGSLPVGEASRFASLADLDEASLEEECGSFGDLDREGHRTAARCVDELLAVAEVTADGRDCDRGGKTQGRGRGGRRSRGRGGRPRGRGRS
ncbi:hypothetical protein Dimus_037038 [Dionaea muscipula]